MRGKRLREGQPPPLAPKRKRQERRRERHTEKQELKGYLGPQYRDKETEDGDA